MIDTNVPANTKDEQETRHKVNRITLAILYSDDAHLDVNISNNDILQAEVGIRGTIKEGRKRESRFLGRLKRETNGSGQEESLVSAYAES